MSELPFRILNSLRMALPKGETHVFAQTQNDGNLVVRVTRLLLRRF